MSLLDVLTIQFEADTGDLNKSIQRTDKSTDELVASLKKADKEADKAGSSFSGFATKAVGALTAALSVGTAISGVIGQATMITQLKQTSDALGVAVEEVDAFGKAAVAMGGDAQGARDSLTDMAESIGEALQDVESGRAKTFAGLKISLRDVKGNAVNAVEGILRLSDAVKGMSREEAIFRIKELGITDNRTVEMVLKGRKELERLLMVQKQSGVVTKQQAEEAKKFTDTINILKSATSSAATGFMSSFIPALTAGVEWLTKIVEWAGEHKDFIVGFFTAVAGIVTAIYLPAMISAAAATLAATWPLIAIGAAIAAVAAAFALAYDDIMNFIDGNDSFIGQIFEQYPMIKQIVFAIINAFRLMGSTITIIWEGIVAAVKNAIATIMGAINTVKSVASKVGGFFSSKVEEGRNMTETGETLDMGRTAIAKANASPYNATTSNSISNSVASNKRETNVQVGEVVVQTQATDADGISRDIGGSLNDQLASLDDEFSTGVDR
jgi:hypothetical protein